MAGSASSQPKSTASPGSTAKGTSAAATATSGASKSQKPTGSAKSTDATDSAAPTGDSANKTESAAASTTASIDDVDPPGGIAMLTPASTTTTYYKIGEDVTLVWNYTSLQVTPSAIDVIASNKEGTWTLTSNASVKETGSVVWHTKDDEGGSNPLLTDTYTLLVYDAKAGVTAAPKPGHLASMMNFQFGMYLPRPYTPLSGELLGWAAMHGAEWLTWRKDFVCATCNGALSDAERQTLGFVFAMGAVTVLSFTWFANGFLGSL